MQKVSFSKASSPKLLPIPVVATITFEWYDKTLKAFETHFAQTVEALFPSSKLFIS